MADNNGKLPEEAAQSAMSADESDRKLECAICLQTCIHPVRLPCTHIFCYLCVKGIANQSKKCAICRHEIPLDYLDKPDMVDVSEPENETVFEDGQQWFYEGRNGWWQYDERTSADLELAHKRGDTKCEVLVAGFLYIVDFQQQIQMRRNDPSRRRRIKRDLANIPKKGVAGISLPSSTEVDPESVPNDVAVVTATTNTTDTIKISTTTPATPSNTPQTPNVSEDNDTSVPSSPRRNSVLDNVEGSLVEALYSLELRNGENNSDRNAGIRCREIELNYLDEDL